jgi:hypothetical protein
MVTPKELYEAYVKAFVTEAPYFGKPVPDYLVPWEVLVARSPLRCVAWEAVAALANGCKRSYLNGV